MNRLDEARKLVEAGKKVSERGPFARFNNVLFEGTFTEAADGRSAKVTGDPTEVLVEGWPTLIDHAAAALNARDTIALLVEIAEASAELATVQQEFAEACTNGVNNDAINASVCYDLARGRLDGLLARCKETR